MSKPIRTGTVGGIPVTVHPNYVNDDGELLGIVGEVRVIGMRAEPAWVSVVALDHIVLDPLPEPDPPRFYIVEVNNGAQWLYDGDTLIATFGPFHPDAKAAAERECAHLNGDTPTTHDHDASVCDDCNAMWDSGYRELEHHLDTHDCTEKPSCPTCGGERTVDDSCGGDSGCTYRKPCPACTPDPLPLADWTVGEARPSLVRLGWWFAYIGPEVGGEPMGAYGRTPDLASENARWLLDRLRQQEVDRG